MLKRKITNKKSNLRKKIKNNEENSLFDCMSNDVKNIIFNKLNIKDLKNISLINKKNKFIVHKIIKKKAWCHIDNYQKDKGIQNIYGVESLQQLKEKVNIDEIRKLKFHDWFNEPIEGLDAKNITHLTFGFYFNQPIEDFNVKNITHLTFGNYLNHHIQRFEQKYPNIFIRSTRKINK